MNLFYDVPQAIQLDLLCQWLQPEDIVKLDSATCSTKRRSDWQALLHSPPCFLRSSRFEQLFDITWLINRGAKVRELYLLQSVLTDSERRRAVLTALGPELLCLDLKLSESNSNDETAEEENAPNSSEHVLDVLFAELNSDVVHFCPKIEKMGITISGCTMDDSLALVFTEFKKLTEISIKECTNIPASVLKAMLSSTSLQSIEFGTNKFAREAFLFEATGCSSCTKLKIAAPLAVGGYQLDKLTMYLPNLTYIKIRVRWLYELNQLAGNCRHVKQAYISSHSPLREDEWIPDYWPNIEVLRISCVGDRGDACCGEDDVMMLLDRCKYLKHLELHTVSVQEAFDYEDATFDDSSVGNSATNRTSSSRSCLQFLSTPTLSVASLQYITTHCINLHTLHLHHQADAIQFDSPAEFALHLINGTTIKTLYLSSCEFLTGAHLLQLHTIECLALSNIGTTASPTNNDVVEMVKQCSALNALHIIECPGITHDVALPLLTARPTMDEFMYWTSSNNGSSDNLKSIVMTIRKLYPNMSYFHMSTSPSGTYGDSYTVDTWSDEV